MRTPNHFLPSFVRQSVGASAAVLFITACGTMQETVLVRDDVYDIPDRTLVASVEPIVEPEAQKGSDDYYNTDEAANYEQGSYYDRTYNDPDWYNRDRFGFGYNSSPWGNSWNMSYGMGYGNNTWFNSPTGYYDPYWSNSWQSGYGYYNPWNGGMYDPWGGNNGWGNGYGCGYGWGMNSCNGWGNNWGWVNGWGYGNGYGYYQNPNYYGSGGWGGGSDFSQTVIVRPRPSMSGGGAQGGANVSVVPRSARFDNGISLMRPAVERTKARTDQQDISRPAMRERDRVESPGTITKDRKQPERKERTVKRTRERSRDTSPRIERDNGGGGGGGNSGGGSREGGGGGGSTPSPRPRR